MNKFTITRHLGVSTVMVIAEYKEQGDVWAMRSYIETTLHATMDSADVFTDAQAMISAAFMEIADLDLTATEAEAKLRA